MTRYEKIIQKDNIADIIYQYGIDNDDSCENSPLRVNGECPVDEKDICKENCIRCINAWLESEVL